MEYLDFQVIKICLILLFFGFALAWDILFHKIPNKLCLIILLIAFPLQVFFLGIYDGVMSFILGLMVAFACLFPLFVIRALGGGDVKLVIGLGSLMGPEMTFWSIVYSLIAGVFTSVVLSLKVVGVKGVLKTFSRYYHIIFLKTYLKPSKDEAGALKVPYAPALALGWFWASYLNGDVTYTFNEFRYVLLG